LTFHNHAHTEAKAALIGDKRNFIRDVATALRRQTTAGELTAIPANAQVNIAGTLFFGLRDGDRAKLF
jgi:hypothetical protein